MSQGSNDLMVVVSGEVSQAFGAGEREVMTPEGISVRLNVAGVSLRAMAFFMDFMLILLFAVFAACIGLVFHANDQDGWFTAFMLVSLFVLRSFYFMAFESLWRGQTPGKRAMNLRVVDASGGALTPGAVMVRNLTRELEMFLPWVALLAPEQFWPGASWVAIAVASAWTLLFMIMPWLNRDRMRIGDLAANTLVIKQPKAYLFEQVTAQSRGLQGARFGFSVDQLDMYGIYEMEVLEDFLRQYPSNPAMEAVAEKVSAKIAWSGEDWHGDVRRFLEDFYEALRARREQDLLFGKRQESKKEGSLGSGALE